MVDINTGDQARPRYLVDGVTGAAVSLSSNTNNALFVQVRGSTANLTDAIAGNSGTSFLNLTDAASTTNPRPLATINYISNGSTLDRSRKPNLTKRVASSAALGNPDFIKATAGEAMQWFGQCGAIATFLQIYNKASAPVIGTDTPILTYPIPANGMFSQTIPNGGLYFGTGIAFAFTIDVAGATGAAAAAITAFALIAA